MGYGGYQVDKQVFDGWGWDKLTDTVKSVGSNIIAEDNAPAPASTNTATSPTADASEGTEEKSTLDQFRDTAAKTRDQVASGDYLGALSTVAGATQGDDAPENDGDDDGWSWWQKALGVGAGGYTAKKVLWDWTLSNLFGGDNNDNNNNNNNNSGGWFGKLLTAGVVIGALVTAAMHWKELKGMATNAFNSVTGNDAAPSNEATNTSSSTYNAEQISSYFKNTATTETSPAQSAPINTSANLFGSALGGAASGQISQPLPSDVKVDINKLERISTSQISGSFAGQISANDGINADKFASNGSKPVIFNAMATAAETSKPAPKVGGRVAGSDITDTLDAE